jgi:DNA-binding response OmpR family regulator
MDPRTLALLVEDDLQLGQALVRSLEHAGLEVFWARTSRDGEQLLRTQAFGIALLDIGLPDGSGLRILKGMRLRDDRTPTILLTARDGLEDRVRGLDEGADDYLVKPFAVPELLSRIRALIRRSAGFAGRVWSLGDITIEPDRRSVKCKGKDVELSPKEFQLLLILAKSAGKVISRAQLEGGIFELGEAPESNAIEVHVHHLRKKLGADRFRTVRGIGYMMEPQ